MRGQPFLRRLALIFLAFLFPLLLPVRIGKRAERCCFLRRHSVFGEDAHAVTHGRARRDLPLLMQRQDLLIHVCTVQGGHVTEVGRSAQPVCRALYAAQPVRCVEVHQVRILEARVPHQLRVVGLSLTGLFKILEFFVEIGVHALAGLIHVGERLVGERVTLLGGLLKQRERLCRVLFDSVAVDEAAAVGMLAVGISELRALLEQLRCLRVILRHAAPVLIRERERPIARRAARIRCLARPL